MRPIDADALIKHISDDNAGYLLSDRLSVIDIEKYIDDAPTIESVPVAHAHWVPQRPNNRTGKAYIFVCSNCKKFAIRSRQASVDELGYVFCPHCGARMDEEEGNDTRTER